MDHYFFMPYLYKVPTVSVEDRNGLAKTLYEETYHAPAPSDSERYEKDGLLTTAGMQFRTMLNETDVLLDEIAATTEYSAVVVDSVRGLFSHFEPLQPAAPRQR